MSQGVYAHFIGVGGAGMSGIARVLHDRGVRVSGSDLKDSRYARALAESGIPIAIGHDASNIGEPEVVVISSAIPETNPELIAARERGIDVWPRARMLAHLAEERTTVAIAGTHGKTSTSAMIATMLDAMGEEPTFLVGGEVTGRGTNAACGDGSHIVVEADESDGSFMYLDPKVALITNIEAEHLDHYGSLDRVEQTFVDFMSKVPADGKLVLCADDTRLCELAEPCAASIITYGSAADADVRYLSHEIVGGDSRFVTRFPDGTELAACVALPGEHMVQNATGALATAWALGLDVAAAAEGLSAFSGVKRRFDRIADIGGVTIVDDYAHHPTEIRATLTAAQRAGFGRVWVLFQPHRYSRTEALAEEFATAFADAHRVVLMDVYSAGETPIPGISGKTVVDSVLEAQPRTRVTYLPHRGDIVDYLAPRLRSGDLVMTMGAGDVTSIGPELVRALGPSEDGGPACR